MRRLIDAGAFLIYGHWVKKGEKQNRAAMFENEPRHEARGGGDERAVFQLRDDG